MQDKLQAFAGKVMSIEPPNVDWLGRGLPGMAGGSAATQGAMTSGSDVTHKLKLKTADFVKARSEHDAAASRQLVKDIEGLLLAEEVLSVLNQKQVDGLIDELHEIMKGE